MLEVDGLKLDSHFVTGEEAPTLSKHGLVLCHGFPAQRSMSMAFGETYPELADRLAFETGWSVMAFDFRGTGESNGNFSLVGWLTDLKAAIAQMLGHEEVDSVWLAGFGTGGSLAIIAAAEDENVRGVASFGAPAHFDDWAHNPERCLERARESGAVKSKDFPTDFKSWSKEFSDLRPESVINEIAPRPIMLVHGSIDEVVSPEEVRILAESGGEQVETRIISGGSHDLRHDPRAIALLQGWMDRHRA